MSTTTVPQSDTDTSELRALVTEMLRDCEHEDAWERLTSSDLTLVGIPESTGGSGGDIYDAAAVLEGGAGSGRPLPLVESTWLAAWLASTVDAPAPTGPVTFAVADQTITATRTDAGYVLDGSVHDVPWRHHVSDAYVFLPAQGLVVVVALPGARPLDGDAVGLCRGDVRLRAATGHPIPISDPEAALLELRIRAALARTVEIAGAATMVRDLAVRYAGEREQFGRPLGRFQVMQHYLAQIAIDAHAIRTASTSAVTAYARQGVAAEPVVRAAKAVASAAVGRLTRLAHQVFGAIGTTREHVLHRYTMALWEWRDDAGDEYHQARAVGRTALDSGADVWGWLVPAPHDVADNESRGPVR